MKKKIYRAIVAFEDLQDKEGTKYQVGDTFPKKGTVTKERMAELEEVGVDSSWLDDEQNACDWEDPVEIEEI